VRRHGLQALFSVNCFAAAMLALWLAFEIGLPRPYWAMATAYIVSQPLTGAMRSKGVYRLVGTLAGGAAALVIVPTFSDAPELLCLALALWVGVCLYVSLLDRTPRSYVFILAGYTAAIIGFPAAPEPGAVFQTAVARVEEIGLGVGCATLVHSLLLPSAVGPVIEARIAAWLADARAWLLDALAGRDLGARLEDRRRLAAEATEIRILSTHLPFDTSNLRDTARTVQALQDQMTLVAPLIPTIADRLQVLRADGPLPADLDARMAAVADWIGRVDDDRPETAEALEAGLEAASPALGEGASWRDVVLDNLLSRLGLLVRTAQSVRELRGAIARGVRRPPRAGLEGDRAGRPAALHRDRYLAFLSALAAVAAVLVCCVAWVGLGWTEGGLAAMNAAVFCSFFATQDDPAPAIATFLWFTVISIPVVALYQFAILPAIDGFPMLAAVLAPPLLSVGYFIGNPATTGRAMPLALGISNGLALAETFSPDFAGFANGDVAIVIGLLAALTITRLFRSVGAAWSARRILRAGWRELARLAASRSGTDRAAFTVAMLDRAGLLVPRLAAGAPGDAATAADALQDVRIGLNLDSLQRARPALAAARGGPAADRLLDGLARHYGALASRGGPDDLGPAAAPPAPLLADLDQALAAGVRAAPASAEAHDGLRALVSLRRSLFPAAPAWIAPAGAAA
jgi:uncharacterized membrane protein YccC